MAAALDTTSLGQWATGGFGGSTSGLASFTSLETGTLALGSAALNYLAVAATWEAGTFVGSAVAATIQQIWPEVRK